MDLLSERRSTSHPIVGREAELARIDALLAAAAGQGGTLRLHGPAGSGLSTLVSEAARRATERGMTVLRTSGAEDEQAFAFAGMHQLLRPLGDALPGPLLAVFGLSDAPPALTRVAGAAVDVLDAAARAAPVLVCIDDAQWLDPPSREVLDLVSRNLGGRRIGLLSAARTGSAEDEDVAWLGPLGEDDAAVLVDFLRPDLDPYTRGRVLEASAGSPLALVELPGALRDAADGALLSPWLPVSDRLARAFAPTLDELPAATREILLALALEDDAVPADAVEAAAIVSGADRTPGDLSPAVDAGLLTLDGDRARFAHELTRAAVVAAATPAERDAAHRALAAVVDSEDRRTRHLAARDTAVGEDLADALAAVARRAQQSGRLREAAAALRRAALLTGQPSARSARLVEAAELVRDIGGIGIAERLLAELDAEALDAAGRARLAILRGRLGAGGADAGATAADLLALAESIGDRDEALRLLQRAVTRTLAVDPGGASAAGLVDAAERIAEPGDPRLISILAAVDPVGRGAEILAAARPSEGMPVETLILLGHAAAVAGDPAGAETLLTAAAAGLDAQRRVEQRIRVLPLLAWAQLANARWDEAERTAHEAVALGRTVRQPIWGAVATTALGMLAGLRGDEDAESYLADAERVALPAGALAVTDLVGWARGSTALSAGRPAEAYGHLLRLHEHGHRQASAVWSVADLAEAAVATGHREAAREVLAAVEPLVAATPAPQVRVAVEHARLVLADEVTADAAYAAAATAVTAAWPFERARIDLAHGMRLRRLRRLADAREPLRVAATAFEQLGARPWAERAHAELAATMESSHRGDEIAARLTPQEHEIATLAAQGLTNGEIGQRLLLSHRTVGSHLARAFRKLEVGSRTELAGALERRSP